MHSSVINKAIVSNFSFNSIYCLRTYKLLHRCVQYLHNPCAGLDSDHKSEIMSDLIDMHNTTVYRGTAKILDRFNLQLPLERNIAILGPNGAGKTTLLKVLMRELYPVRTPDSWVRILGKETWNVWELRKRLGFISQDLQNRYVGYVKGLDVVLSGFHSSIGVYNHQEYKLEWIELSRQVMVDLRIDSIQEKWFSHMSTGEQRRFLLARALVSEPATLVLDEPTSGLDLTATFLYLQLMRNLMQKGKQIVLVTHHIHEIPPEVDYVVLIKKGKITARGDKSDLLTNTILSDLYGTKMKVMSANGYYQVIPVD